MLSINLLPWRENLRRKKRRKKMVKIILVLSLILGGGGIGHCLAVARLGSLQKNEFWQRSELNLIRKELAEWDLVLERLDKKEGEFLEREKWRRGFFCPLSWLDELGVKLPTQCLIEKMTVRSGKWNFVALCDQGVKLKKLLELVGSLENLEQVSVLRLWGDENKDSFHIEMDALIACGKK